MDGRKWIPSWELLPASSRILLGSKKLIPTSSESPDVSWQTFEADVFLIPKHLLKRYVHPEGVDTLGVPFRRDRSNLLKVGESPQCSKIAATSAY